MCASFKGHTEIVKILVEQEGIDINAKNKIYFNNFMFQNNIWNFFKLFETALMCSMSLIESQKLNSIGVICVKFF